MADLGNLFFRIGADTKGLQKSEQQIKKFAQNSDKEIQKTNKSFLTFGRSIKAVGLIAAGFSLRTADSFSVLQQRIKTATKDTGDFARVSRELGEISKVAGSTLSTNVSLFQGLARVSSDLGASNGEILTLVETLSNLGRIGGASTDQLSNGLLQFNQGLAAGVFRAEEMNSVIENIPEVAARIAKGMGLTTGELRRAVVEGEVLSRDVFDALLIQSEAINKEAKEIAPSLGFGFNALKTSTAQLLGSINESLGLTSKLSQGMVVLSSIIDNYIIKAFKNLKPIFNQFIDESVVLISNLGLRFQLVWNEIKHGGITVAQSLSMVFVKIADVFARAMNSTLSGLSGLLQKIPGLGGVADRVNPGEFRGYNADLGNRRQNEQNRYEDTKASLGARIQENLAGLSGNNEMEEIGKRNEALFEMERIKENTLAEIQDEAREAKKEKDQRTALETLLGVQFKNKALLNDEQKSAGLLQGFLDDVNKTTVKQQGEKFTSLIGDAAKHSEAMFNIQKSLAVATALIEAPKAVLSAYTFGAGLGGPILGAIFGATAAAATAIQVQGIASAQFKGGKALGGSVDRNSMYEVNEKGMELLSTGGRDYLLTGGQSGNITPNNKLGGGKVVVNVYPQPGQEANVTSNEDGSMIDIMIENVENFISNQIVEGGNVISNTFESQYNLLRS